ncbi:Leishmanolysin [Novymonas esmeraldas]|uniref:Leishmanolysin-like peptidase n=1 Tax=Novymonas esmeraldas TaxID=1808958 RepID=A0AAW0ES81_9TRYP
MRHAVMKTGALVVLLCAVVRGWTGQPEEEVEHRCGFDELQTRTIGTRVSRVVDASGERSVAASEWRPLRIAVFAHDIADTNRHCTEAPQVRPNFNRGATTCKSGHVLTRAKKQTLMDLLIPSAVQLHTERLSVQRENGNIVVTPSIKQDALCS